MDWGLVSQGVMDTLTHGGKDRREGGGERMEGGHFSQLCDFGQITTTPSCNSIICERSIRRSWVQEHFQKYKPLIEVVCL